MSISIRACAPNAMISKEASLRRRALFRGSEELLGPSGSYGSPSGGASRSLAPPSSNHFGRSQLFATKADILQTAGIIRSFSNLSWYLLQPTIFHVSDTLAADLMHSP